MVQKTNESKLRDKSREDNDEANKLTRSGHLTIITNLFFFIKELNITHVTIVIIANKPYETTTLSKISVMLQIAKQI